MNYLKDNLGRKTHYGNGASVNPQRSSGKVHQSGEEHPIRERTAFVAHDSSHLQLISRTIQIFMNQDNPNFHESEYINNSEFGGNVPWMFSRT